MRSITGVLVMLLVSVLSQAAQAADDWTGLSFSLGVNQSDGDFSLSHRGQMFSFGEILNVPLSGTVTTYEIGYRFPIGGSNLRLGVNAILHDGAIGGSKTWDSRYATATFAVTSDLRLSLGAEVGTVIGKRERLYVYAGAGMVATDLAASFAIDTPFGDWSKNKEGGAVGAIYRLGLQYQVNDSLSVGLSVSQMEFDAGKAFGLGDMGEQRFEAELEQTIFGLNISYNF